MTLKNIFCELCEDFTAKERRGATMNYLTAIICVLAMVAINLWGKESSEINTILSGVIAACVWGGVQRAQGQIVDAKKESEKTPDGKG